MEAFGDPSERAWVAGKAIVMFEGRHQFEELPVLRRRGKQKEKGYRHKVFFFFFFKASQIMFLGLEREESPAFLGPLLGNIIFPQTKVEGMVWG